MSDEEIAGAGQSVGRGGGGSVDRGDKAEKSM